MKRFDPEAIDQRLRQRLQVKEEWANIISNGTIGNLTKEISESEAEIARYLEYLFLEKKWKTARNISSLTHTAALISRKRMMAQSSIGYALISHTDPLGVQRLNNFGSIFFDLDQQSDWDDLYQNADASFTEKSALTPWMSNDVYGIPKGSTFKTGSGIEFVSLETVEIRPLTEPWSSIKANEERYYNFIKAGGWNGIKYLKVPIIQGTMTSVILGQAKGDRFESFVINSGSVEAAANTISEKYFNIFVTPSLQGVTIPTEEWEQIENIRLAGPFDKVYEIKYLSNSSTVLVKFGDGITGQTLPPGARVSCDYIETKGGLGNVDERFQLTTMILPNGESQVDPRTNKQTEFLAVTNIVPILGGKDIENETDFKINAPVSYLKSYAIATIEAYKTQIMTTAPVSLLRLRVFKSRVAEAESYGVGSGTFVSSITSSVMNEVTHTKNAIVLCAIRANGTKFDDPETELIQPIVKALADKKSPADSFSYLEPNFIQLRANVTVATKETLPEKDVVNQVIPPILSKYSVFNTDFEEPVHKSVIDDLASQFSYVSYVNSFIEARANVDMNPVILSRYLAPSDILSSSETLVAFKFTFDKSFGRNKDTAGFKNFRQSSQYLVRADIKFKDDPENNKSFFLFDNRINKAQVLELMKAESSPIDMNVATPTVKLSNYSGFGEYSRFNEYDANFVNRQVRTAQFDYINKITSDDYVLRMKLFNVEPYENRPLYVDNYGRNKQFLIAEVPEDEQVSLTLTGVVTGDYCFRRNDRYYDDSKIIFYENFSFPDDPLYATGYLVVPLDRIMIKSDIDDLKTMFATDLSIDRLGAEIRRLLTERVVVHAFAKPITDDYETVNENDIIFIDDDDILVEKLFLK